MSFGGEPEPPEGNHSHHETEEESKSMQILALVTGVVAASIFFEKLKDYIEESVESEELKPIVRHLFGELTVLGFIGLVIFILDKTGIPKEWTEKTEQIHMVIFVVSLVFLTAVMILVRMGKTMAKYWRDAEDVIIDPVHDRISLLDEYLFRKEKAKDHQGIFGMFSDKVKAYHNAQFQLEYHGIRDAFLRPDIPTVHHGVSPHEAKRIEKQLLKDFNLADYLNSCMAEALTEIVEIQATTWFSLYLIFLPFWVILDRFETPHVAIYAFLGLPYLMLVALIVIKRKLRFVRSQLVPSFMYEAARIVEGAGAEGHYENPTELESAPLLGSLNGDANPTMGSRRSRATSENSGAPVLDVMALRGNKRRRQSTIEPPPTQHLRAIGAREVQRLQAFIIQSDFEFAHPKTIPYWHQQVSTLHKGTHGFTKWLHGLGGKHAQGETHSHTPSLHEQLFWYSRNGAHFLLHLIRTILMLFGIYIAVISTAIMPAVWRHTMNKTSGECLPFHHEEGLDQFGPTGYTEEPGPEKDDEAYCFSFTMQVVYTAVGFLPIFLIIPQFYHIVHNFVIAANCGMMRDPKIVSKVFRSGKTRKSLRVLKLLSSMKHGSSHSGGKSSPTPSGGKASRKPSKRLHEMKEAAKTAFELLDEDGGGTISHEELGTLLSNMRLNVSPEELAKTVKELDDDNSGQIDEREFMAWIEKISDNEALDLTDPEAIEEFVDVIFAAIDIDNDGNVTTEELRTTLNSLGQNLEFEDVREIMADIDKDMSGSVDKEEFLQMIKEHAAYL